MTPASLIRALAARPVLPALRFAPARVPSRGTVSSQTCRRAASALRRLFCGGSTAQVIHHLSRGLSQCHPRHRVLQPVHEATRGFRDEAKLFA